MDKPKPVCVKEHPPNRDRISPPGVSPIPYDRMIDCGKMDPNLMSATGFQIHVQQRGHLMVALDPVVGAARTATGDHLLAGRMDGVAADRGIDGPRWHVGDTMHKSQITSVNPMVPQVGDQAEVGRRVPGDQQQTAGSLIKAMNYPPPAGFSHPLQIRVPVQETSGQGSRMAPRARMHDQPGWFVYNQ
jgi:hypothetical protein